MIGLPVVHTFVVTTLDRDIIDDIEVRDMPYRLAVEQAGKTFKDLHDLSGLVFVHSKFGKQLVDV